MQFNESTAKAWLTSNIGSLVPPNTRRYTHGVVTQSLGTNLLGMKTDLRPFEGVVVHCGDGFYVVKTGRNAFKLVDPSILRETLIEGSKVRITPYQRRRFNGTLLSDPESIEDNGTYLTKTYVLGVNHSEIPLATPQTQYLLDALDLLHRGKCPDGVRLISNMLVDINATNFSMQEPIEATHDDDGNEVTAEQWHEPQISFDCKSNAFAGRVTVGVDVASDTYFVDLQKPDETGALQPHTRCNSVYFDGLATVLTDLLCDGEWRFANVDVLKAAPKAKPSKVSEAVPC